MRYICENQATIDKFIKHINRKSICEIICKIFYSKFLNSSLRNEIFNKILSSFESNDEVVFCASELLEDILLNNFFIDIDFENIHSLLIKIPPQSIGYQELLRILIKFYEQITDKNSNSKNDKLNFDSIQNSFHSLKKDFMSESTHHLPSSFNTQIKVLGLRR